jgi:hypothetical protein
VLILQWNKRWKFCRKLHQFHQIHQRQQSEDIQVKFRDFLIVFINPILKSAVAFYRNAGQTVCKLLPVAQEAQF